MHQRTYQTGAKKIKRLKHVSSSLSATIVVGFLLVYFEVITEFSFVETNTTHGEVMGLTYNVLAYSDDGHTKAWYRYTVKEALYVDTVYFSGNDQILSEGTIIEVEYMENNPQESRVVDVLKLPEYR